MKLQRTQVMAKAITTRYVKATMVWATPVVFSFSAHVMAASGPLSACTSCPYTASRAPTAKRKTIMKKDPISKVWSTAPLVKEQDGWDGHDDVQDVLNRGGEKRVTNAGRLHDVDHVVHPFLSVTFRHDELNSHDIDAT